MQNGMFIGTKVDKDSLEAVTESITKILSLPNVDQLTKTHAIDALARMSQVKDVTIQNCVINGDRKVDVMIDAGSGEVTTNNGSFVD